MLSKVLPIKPASIIDKPTAIHFDLTTVNTIKNIKPSDKLIATFAALGIDTFIKSKNVVESCLSDLIPITLKSFQVDESPGLY